MTILTYCFFSVQYSVSSFRKPTRLQACLALQLPKYMQVGPLLRYSRSVFRTRLNAPLPIRSKRAATDDSSLLTLIDLLYFPHALIANESNVREAICLFSVNGIQMPDLVNIFLNCTVG